MRAGRSKVIFPASNLIPESPPANGSSGQDLDKRNNIGCKVDGSYSQATIIGDVELEGSSRVSHSPKVDNNPNAPLNPIPRSINPPITECPNPLAHLSSTPLLEITPYPSLSMIQIQTFQSLITPQTIKFFLIPITHYKKALKLRRKLATEINLSYNGNGFSDGKY